MGTALGWTRFLQLHPRGVFAERATEQLAFFRFRDAESRGDLAAFRRFLRLHAEHPLAAKAWLHVVSEEGHAVLKSDRREPIVAYLSRYPQSDLAEALRRRLEEIDRGALGPEASAFALERFLKAHPSSPEREAIWRRLERRWVDILLSLGEVSDLHVFRERFAGSSRLADIEAAVARRTLTDALLRGDTTWLRSEIARRFSSLPPQRRRVLGTWEREGGMRLGALHSLVREAAPFRPQGSFSALITASRIGDSPTASYALAALSYAPSVSAARAIVQGLASPNTGVSFEALRSLVRWLERAPGSEARRLLVDLAAEAETGQGGGTQVMQLGILWALQDWPGVVNALARRPWNRPWDVLPYTLWLEHLAPESPETRDVGKRALEVLRQELRRLGEVIPTTLDQENLQRAQAGLFELEALARLLRRLSQRHPPRAPWAHGLGRLTLAAEQRLSEAQRSMASRVTPQDQLRADSLEKEAARHRAGQTQALGRLLERIRLMGPPPEIMAILCDVNLDLGTLCTSR